MRSFSFCSIDSMNAVLVPPRADYTTSSDSIIHYESSDLDLMEILDQDENREDADEKRDSRSEPRISNSSEGAEDPSSDSSLVILLESIDTHAKRLGMNRLEFLSRLESFIRSDGIENDSNSIREDETSGDSESTASSSGGPVYSFTALLDEINRLFQCASHPNETFKEISLDGKRLGRVNYERPILDRSYDSDRPSFCSPVMNEEHRSFPRREKEALSKSLPKFVDPHMINAKMPFDVDREMSNYNNATFDKEIFPTKTNGAQSNRRSLISLSSSSSSESDYKENDESVPAIKTGGSFISYSTEGISTLQTRSDFKVDSSNFVNSFHDTENIIDKDANTRQRYQDSNASLQSKKQSKGWARFFRRLRHRSSR